MMFSEDDYKFSIGDLEGLVSDPIDNPILTDDIYVPVFEDLGVEQEMHLAALKKLFPEMCIHCIADTEDNEFTIFKYNNQPHHRMYFKLYMPDELPNISGEDKVFQLASGSVLSCYVPDEFCFWPEEIQNSFLEAKACSDYEDEEGGCLHRRIDDQRWVYLNIMSGEHSIWHLDEELTKAALIDIAEAVKHR